MVDHTDNVIIVPEKEPGIDSKKFSVDSEYEKTKNDSDSNFGGSCLFYCVTFFFILVLSIGVYEFIKYDKQFSSKTKEYQKILDDSLKKRERSIYSGKIAEEMHHDSILNAEIKSVKEADSLELIRVLQERAEARRQDSIRVDTFMTHVIKSISLIPQVFSLTFFKSS